MNYTTTKISDYRVVQKLSELVKEVDEKTEVTCSFRLLDNTNQISKDVTATYDTEKGFLFDDIDFKGLKTAYGSFSLTLKKGTSNYSYKLKREDILDSITVNYTNGNNNQQQTIHPKILMDWMQKVQKLFPQHARDAKIDKLIGDELAEFYRKRESALCRLEGASHELFESLALQRAEADKAITNERQTLQESWDHKQQKLEADYQNKLADLEQKNALLDEREAKINDNNSKYERRSLRDQLKASISSRNERFTVTKDTMRTRLPVHVIYMVLVGVSGFFLVLFSLALSKNPSDYVLLFKTITSSAVLLTTALLYIRWNDAWSQRYANEEFNQKRLELDIDRASWVVEMLLEWDEAKDQPIPPELINRLTNCLFERVEQESNSNQQADFLSTLLGGTSTIDLNVPGGNMHMKRSGVKKLRNELQGE